MVHMKIILLSLLTLSLLPMVSRKLVSISSILESQFFALYIRNVNIICLKVRKK